MSTRDRGLLWQHIKSQTSGSIHGFFYLDDAIVTNSFSALEAGKIDSIVEKISTARAGGFGAGIGLYGVRVEGDNKTSSEFKEELVRTRTRFSIFEQWYKMLDDNKAIGRFDELELGVLAEIQPGEVVEFQASLELTPAQTLLRTFIWFVGMASQPGNMFSQQGAELKTLKTTEKQIRMIMGTDEDSLPLVGRPESAIAATITMALIRQFLIGRPGDLVGRYTIVGQVEQVLHPGDAYPTVRLTSDAPPTELELNAWREVYAALHEPAKAFGLDVSDDDPVVKGPALLITPIAIYR